MRGIYIDEGGDDRGVLAKAMLNGQRPPEQVFEYFRKIHEASYPAKSPE